MSKDCLNKTHSLKQKAPKYKKNKWKKRKGKKFNAKQLQEKLSDETGHLSDISESEEAVEEEEGITDQDFMQSSI